jgi:hypothetical protein
MKYRSIVFLSSEETDGEMPDGSDAIVQDEALRILHHKSTKPGTDDYESVVWECPTQKSVNAALDYMLQWDYERENMAVTDESPAGSSDYTETVTRYFKNSDGRRERHVYEITYNVGLSYIGLCEIVPD